MPNQSFGTHRKCLNIFMWFIQPVSLQCHSCYRKAAHLLVMHLPGSILENLILDMTESIMVPSSHVLYSSLINMQSPLKANDAGVIASIEAIDCSHDDVMKRKYFPRYWPFVKGIHRSPVDSPRKGQWRGALNFFLIWAWTNDWANNREAGDLRRHRAYCDVNSSILKWNCEWYFFHLSHALFFNQAIFAFNIPPRHWNII